MCGVAGTVHTWTFGTAVNVNEANFRTMCWQFTWTDCSIAYCLHFLFILKMWTALYFVLLPSWRWCWRRIRTKTGSRFKWRNSVSSTMEVLRSSVSSGLHHHYRRRRTAACDQRVTWQQQKKNMRLFIFVRWVKTLQTIMEFEMLDLKMFI